MKYIIIDAY